MAHYTLNERLIAAVGYLGVLFLIPLFFKRESQFAQFHGKQGLVLFVAWAIISLIAIIPVLGWIIWLVGNIVLVVLMIVGILKAYIGELWEMPYLGKYAKRVKI